MGSKQGAIKVAAARLGLSLDEYTAKIADGLKWCITCNDWHPVGAFGRDDSRGDGLASRRKASAYQRITDGPGKNERIAQAQRGLSWCRDCRAWLLSADVRSGCCRRHIAENARIRYATDSRYRAERRQHAHSRERNVAPVPVLGQ